MVYARLIAGTKAKYDIWYKSDAVLMAMRQCYFPFSLITVARILPKCMRDFCYDKVAMYRYKLFGKIDHDD